MLFLSNELYLGFIKLQADRGLGRAYAGLLPFVEGLYRLGYISLEVYDEHRDKYSNPLISEKPKALTHQQEKAEKNKEHLDGILGRVADQWQLHPSLEWRQRWVCVARQNPDLPSSKSILVLAEKEVMR